MCHIRFEAEIVFFYNIHTLIFDYEYVNGVLRLVVLNT